MVKVFSYLACLLSATLVLQGCETVKQLFGPGPDRIEPGVRPEYWEGGRIRIGVALVIQVGTPASAPQTMSVLVDQNGAVTIPYLLQEPVMCEGLKLEAFKQKLMKAYSYYLKQPQISVTFAPFDGHGVSPWGAVTVLGEVNSPGPVNVPSTMELSVTRALQMAGGVKPFADRSKILVSRCDKDGNITRTYIDLKEIGKEGRVDKDMSLRGGDVVWVPETWY